MTSASVTVGASAAVQLASGLKSVTIQNLGPYNVYVGGSNVSASNGFFVPVSTMASDLVKIGLTSAEALYAIADSAAGSNTTDVRVLTYLG